jgi:hypothetical protein
VRFSHVHIQADKGLRIIHARGIEFDDCSVQAGEGPPIAVTDGEIRGIDPGSGK